MKVIAFFQLIRWKNLFMLIISQILLKYSFFQKYAAETSLNILDFTLLISSVVSIYAGGFIINDIYDIKSDLVNKPNKVFIGSVFSIKEAIFYYVLLTLSGIIAGTFLSFKIGYPYFSLIFILMSLLLFFYSKQLKKIALIGNFTIAILVVLSLLIIGVFELIPSISITNGTQEELALKLLLIYALFSASINLIREVVKDIEDIDGDFSQKMKTLPILIGRKRTNIVVIVLSIVFVMSLFTILFVNRNSNFSLFIFGLILIILPLLYFISKMYSAETKSDYHKLSSMLKIIMIFGVLAIFVL